jgi:DNA-binding sugar fermentation-stimulating protein
MPIRSDARGNLIKASQYKKKKYNYRFTCGDEHIVGATDDPRRTLEAIWKVYRDCVKNVCVDFGVRNKVKELCIEEDDNSNLIYTYCSEEITKHKFKQLLDEH